MFTCIMHSVRRAVSATTIATCLSAVFLSAAAHGAATSEPLYSINNVMVLEPWEYKSGGIELDFLRKEYKSMSLFPVPRDNSVGTCDLEDAMTLISFPNRHINFDENFNDTVSAIGGYKPVNSHPVIFQDGIGFGLSNDFLIYDFKKRQPREYRITGSFSKTIKKTAVADAGKRQFIFGIDSQNTKRPRDKRDRAKSLQLMDLSGDEARLIKEIMVGKYTTWHLVADKIVLYDLKTEQAQVVNQNLEPADHPLANAIKQNKGRLDFSQIHSHPYLPFAILSDGENGPTTISWNAGRDNKPISLFGKRVHAGEFSFSPDGKWVLFRKHHPEPEKTYIMPVSEKYPHYLGSPILLAYVDFERNALAWTTNPTSLVGSHRETIYRWELTNELHPESDKATFWDYTVEHDLQRIKKRAAEGSAIDKIKRLIASNTNINAKDKNDHGYTALMKAADDGNAELVGLLIEANADLHVPGKYAAIALAARAGHIDIVKTLMVRSKSDINSALMEAVKGGHADIVKLLIDAKADVNERFSSFEISPLFVAVRNGNTEIVKLLIDAKADVNVKNERGYPVIAEAVTEGHTDIVRLLINAKADVNVRYSYYNSPLLDSEEKGYLDIMKLLIDAKAEVNSRGLNALSRAIEHGDADMVKLLIDAKADIGETGKLVGNLKILGRWKNDEIEKILKDAGAKYQP